MKKLIALVVLSTAAVSYAAERKIYDLMYLPNQGTIYGFSVLSYEAANLYESSVKSDVNGYKFDQTIGYSVLKNLTLNVAMDYLNYQNHTSGAPTQEKSGLSDLNLNARYRLIEGESDLDLIAYGQLSTGDSEIDTDGDLDNKSGGNTLGLGAQWGQRKETFQWALLGRVDRLMEATIENKNTNVDSDSDAHNRYLLQADILGRMSEQFFFRGALSATIVDGFDIENESQASRNDYKITGELQHLTTQDLLVRVGISNSNVETDSVDQYTIWNIFAGANYQF